MAENELIPIEQKQVIFYEDEITTVLVRDQSETQIFVPLRPICEYLGIDWPSQYQRVNRDEVLSDTTRSIVVITTDRGPREMVCLPLDFLPGWLFTINARRVRPELKPKIVRYQRECYQVLSEAFQEGRLTARPSFEDLLQANSPAVQAYKTFKALTELARNQILLEARLDERLEKQDVRLGEHEIRIEQLESQLGDPDRHVTPDQASQISQAVKAVAMQLSKASGRNEYGGVYGELYRKFGITSYKQLPAGKFQEAIDWLSEWLNSLTEPKDQVPF